MNFHRRFRDGNTACDPLVAGPVLAWIMISRLPGVWSRFAFGALPALFNFRDEHDRANADANGIERVLASPVTAASMPSMNILRR